MTEQVQRRQRTQRDVAAAEAKIADLSNSQLAEAVECCLADIDCCLAEVAPAKTERQIAQEKWESFRQLSDSERERAERQWTAQYGHLFHFCCGMPQFD